MAALREYITPEGLRLDGRRANEIRRVECELGMFSRVDGCAYYEQGHTKVVVSVYGPREAARRGDTMHDKANINVEYSIANFSTSERKTYSKQDRRATEIALLIRQTFESAVLTHLFPRSQINIFVHMIQNDGGALSAAINATTIALINAGIPMKYFVTSCTAGFVDSVAVADLNYVEKSSGSPELTVAIDPNSGNIALMQMDSKLSAANFNDVTDLAVKGCKEVHRILRQKVKDYSFSLKKS